MNNGRKNIRLIQLILLICLVNTTLSHYNNTEVHHRSRRDLASDEEKCDALDKADKVTPFISKLPVIGELFDTALTVVKYGLNGDYIKTACSDIPFEKIKVQMQERFDKLDAKIDRNFAAIQRLYNEIHRLISDVEISIKDSRIHPILSGLKMFIEGFRWYQSRIDEYFNDDNFDEVERVLVDLKDSIKRIGGLLSMQVNDILNQNFAIPEDSNDKISVLAFHALYYGVHAHVSVLLFLLEKRTLLADHHYANNDIENYHNQLRMMKVLLSDLKALRSTNYKGHFGNNVFGYDFRQHIGEDNSLFDRFYNTARLAVRKIDVQRRDRDKPLKDGIHELVEEMRKANNEISELVVSIVKETPVFGKISIKKKSESLRVLDDKDFVKVKYAIQYKRDSTYFMVSDWTVGYTLSDKHYAEIKLPAVIDGTTRLIFRHVSTEKLPQLVGIIDDASDNVFVDIHRDLYNAAWENDNSDVITTTLIKNGANVNEIFENGRTPFHAAAEANNVKVGEVLFNNIGNINVQDDNGYTPLHLAAKLGNIEFCEFLLNKDANGNLRTTPDGLTALQVAAIHKQKPTVEKLMEYPKVYRNLQDKNGNTALHHAVNSSASVVEVLAKNATVMANIKNNAGFTPLHYAVANKDQNIISALFHSKNININVASNNLSPLHQAIMDKSDNIGGFLLSIKGVKVDIDGPEGLKPIHFAVMTGNSYLVKLLVHKKANLAAQSKTGMTALHFAVTLRNFDMINLLLDNGFQHKYINLATNEGYTAMHMAANGYDYGTITSKLKQNGAKLDATTNNGFTPLHIAAIHNKVNIFNSLKDLGANLQKTTADRKAYWELAVEKGSLNIIMNNFPDNLDPLEKTRLLNAAVSNGHLDVFKYLVENKEFTYADDDRNDFLYKSIVNNHTETSKYFIDSIAKSSGYNLASLGRHLVAAARAGNLQTVEHLESKQEERGSSTMYWRFIESFDTHVDKTGKLRNRTALHEAVYAGNRPMIDYLIFWTRTSGLDLTDDRGKTVADVAKEKNLNDIYGMFENLVNCDEFITTSQLQFIDERCMDKSTRIFSKRLNIAVINDKIDVATDLINRKADINGLDENGNTPLHLALARQKYDFVDLILLKNPDVRIKNNSNQLPYDVAKEHGAPEEIIEKLIKMENELNMNDGLPM